MPAETQLKFSTFTKSAERIFLWSIIALLISANIFTVTNSSFQQSLFSLLSHIPFDGLLKNSLVANKNLIELDNRNLRQQYQLLNDRWQTHRTKTIAIKDNIVKRSVKNVTKNVSSVLGEATPYVGAALIISVTADDVIDACANIRDINEMAMSLEIESAFDEQNTVCGTKLPNVDEVIASIGEFQDQTKESAGSLFNGVRRTMYQMLPK